MMLLLLAMTMGALSLVTYQLEKRILIDQIRQRALLMGKTLEVNLSELILKTPHEDLASIPEEEKQAVREFIQNFGEEQKHLDIDQIQCPRPGSRQYDGRGSIQGAGRCETSLRVRGRVEWRVR